MGESDGSLSRLEALPPELLSLVCGHVRPPKHLANLCLVSRTLRSFATPCLYEEITISHKLPASLLEPGHGLLSVRNQGIRHIRHLRVPDNDGVKREKQCRTFVRRLLQIMPRNTLHTLFIPDLKVDESLFSTIISSQQSIHDLALGLIAFDSGPLLSPSFIGDSVWQDLRSLQIPRDVHSEKDLLSYGMIMRQAKNLRKLAICTDHIVDNPGLLQSIGSTEDTVFSSLFGREAPQQEALKLESLCLENVSVCDPKRCLMQGIDFLSLQDLRLTLCENVPSLLNELALLSAKGCSLKVFWIETFDDCGASLDGFLGSFAGLRALYITVSEGRLDGFGISCLIDHQSTLEELVVGLPNECDCDAQDREDHNPLPLARFANRCMRLKHLGLHLGPLRLMNTGSQQQQNFDAILATLLSSLHLEVLRIFSLPAPGRHVFAQIDWKTSNSSDDAIAKYSKIMDRFQGDLLRRLEDHNQLRGRKPPLICYAACHGARLICDGSEVAKHIMMKPLLYLRGSEAVARGPRRTCAVRIPLEEAKERWPHHKILHFDADY